MHGFSGLKDLEQSYESIGDCEIEMIKTHNVCLEEEKEGCISSYSLAGTQGRAGWLMWCLYTAPPKLTLLL